jgi:hypothetical protein
MQRRCPYVGRSGATRSRCETSHFSTWRHMTSDDRRAMDVALKAFVVPALRSRGFKGSLPHFRRSSTEGIDLITVQFDKWGGGFVIELARCSAAGFVTSWGKEIACNKVSAWDLPFSWRHRVMPGSSGGPDDWFRFEDGRASKAAEQVLDRLSEIEVWFAADRASNGERPNSAPTAA